MPELTDWRELERARVEALEAQGIRVPRCDWVCDHAQHDCTDGRGPITRTQMKLMRFHVRRDHPWKD